MVRTGTRALALLLLSAGPAGAEVTASGPGGFESSISATIAAPPERVYHALGQIGRWWSAAHTFSGNAANLRLELTAGGCLCEKLPGGGSAEHMRVVYVAPRQTVRLRGALGPLQGEGVDGALTWTLQPADGGTRLLQRYVVGGYARDGLAGWAPKVDAVLKDQVERLQRFLATGTPEPPPAAPPPR